MSKKRQIRDPQYFKDWHAAHPGYYRRKGEARRAELAKKEGLKLLTLFRKYGSSSGLTYNDFLVKQGGVCAICRNLPPKGKRLCIDHCHTTKQIRGLLCSPCNTGLGFFRDNPKTLRAALEYLIRSRENYAEELVQNIFVDI